MPDELFADGVGEITVTGHVVRIDLVGLSPVERDAGNNPVTRFRQRIVMPVDAFANAVELMQRVVNGLVEAEVVARRAQPAAASPGAASTLPASPSSPSPSLSPDRETHPAGSRNASPNFN